MRSEPLEPEFAEVLYKHRWELYTMFGDKNENN